MAVGIAGRGASRRRRAVCILAGIAVWLLWDTVLVSSTFRVDSRLVLVNVSVVDSAGRPLSSLNEQQFTVFENGRQQHITSFAHEDVPVSIALIFDRSGSMTGKVDRARKMVARFCEALGDGDEVFLVTVQDKPRLDLDYRSNCAEIQSALLNAPARGTTALLDAIPMALRHLKSARNSRKIILAISDGGENASRMRPAGIRRLLLEADVPFYAAAFFDPDLSVARQAQDFVGETYSEQSLLEAFAQDSGGRYYDIDEFSNLAQAATKISTVIHDQYVIGYHPQGLSQAGKYRRISVKVQRDCRTPRPSVSARGGYYEPAE